MRVLYNGIPLMPPRTGIGRYVENLCRALVELDPSVRCEFLYTISIARGLPAAAGAEPPRRRIASPSRLFFQRLIFTPPLTRLYPPVMDALFRLRSGAGCYDVYHETNYIPRPFRGPTVVTVYDLSLALHPETHPEARVYLFERDFVRRMSRVDRFLAISEAVKQELVGTFNVDPARIAVTPLGVDREHFHPRGNGGVAVLAARSAAAGGAVPTDHLLFVGSLEPRKNLTVLFRAYAELPPPLRARHPIVLAGPPGWKFEPIWEEARALGLEDRIIRPGFLDEAALAELYRRAAALVLPSLYEGFGLPLVEAMASGTPVVCSDIPSFAEVGGDAVLRIPPHDVSSWAAALERVLTDEALREQLRSAGLGRAAGFTWRRCAEQTLAVYRDLL